MATAKKVKEEKSSTVADEKPVKPLISKKIKGEKKPGTAAGEKPVKKKKVRRK